MRSAIDAAARLFHGQEKEIPVDGDVALPARAYNGNEDPRFLLVFDTVCIEAVELDFI